MLQELHQRGADRLLQLCFANGGIYVKLGQHVGQLVRRAVEAGDGGARREEGRLHQAGAAQATAPARGDTCSLTLARKATALRPFPAPQDHILPDAYVSTMRSHLLDRCPVSSYAEVRAIIAQDLGDAPERLFRHFSPNPIASASLAQVRGVRGGWGKAAAHGRAARDCKPTVVPAGT